MDDNSVPNTKDSSEEKNTTDYREQFDEINKKLERIMQMIYYYCSKPS